MASGNLFRRVGRTAATGRRPGLKVRVVGVGFSGAGVEKEITRGRWKVFTSERHGRMDTVLTRFDLQAARNELHPIQQVPDGRNWDDMPILDGIWKEWWDAGLI